MGNKGFENMNCDEKFVKYIPTIEINGFDSVIEDKAVDPIKITDHYNNKTIGSLSIKADIKFNCPHPKRYYEAFYVSAISESNHRMVFGNKAITHKKFVKELDEKKIPMICDYNPFLHEEVRIPLELNNKFVSNPITVFNQDIIICNLKYVNDDNGNKLPMTRSSFSEKYIYWLVIHNLENHEFAILRTVYLTARHNFKNGVHTSSLEGNHEVALSRMPNCVISAINAYEMQSLVTLDPINNQWVTTVSPKNKDLNRFGIKIIK